MKYLVPRHPTKPIRSLADAMNEIGKQDATIAAQTETIRKLREALKELNDLSRGAKTTNMSRNSLCKTLENHTARILAETEEQ